MKIVKLIRFASTAKSIDNREHHYERSNERQTRKASERNFGFEDLFLEGNGKP